MKLKESLKKGLKKELGLTEKEIELYFTLIKIGKSTVQKIAREINVQRPTAYLLIESLAKKGLITQEFKKHGRFVNPESPKILRRLVAEKERRIGKISAEIEKNLPGLIGEFESTAKDPVIKVYEGVEGLKALHDDIIETGQDLYCYPRLDVALDILPYEYQAKFMKERIKRNIRAYAITTESPELYDTYRKSNIDVGAGLREARILPDPLRDKLTSEKMFYGNKVAYMTYGKKITGVVIEHEEIAGLERKHFNIIWRISKPFRYNPDRHK